VAPSRARVSVSRSEAEVLDCVSCRLVSAGTDAHGGERFWKRPRQSIPIAWAADPAGTRYRGAVDVKRAAGLYAQGWTCVRSVSSWAFIGALSANRCDCRLRRIMPSSVPGTLPEPQSGSPPGELRSKFQTGRHWKTSRQGCSEARDWQTDP
jgi:hypothetical protein